MNDIQCKAAAAGFIHALKQSRELRNRWADIRNAEEWENLRTLIGETLGLAQTPSPQDLEKMRGHCDSQLGPQLKELQQIDERIEPRYVCNGAHPGGN